MNVTIQLPAPMRQYADGQAEVAIEADTVGRAVDALCARHHALRQRLLKPSGKLKSTIAIFVNNAQPAATPDTELNDGDRLVVLQPVGGG